MSNANDDEALARALQEEYDHEFQTSVRQNSNSVRYTMPPPTNPAIPVNPFDSVPPPRPASAPEVSDEELARRLAVEEAGRFRKSNSIQSKGEATTSTETSSSNTSPNAEDDEEYAKRLQQELRDEEIARRMNEAERVRHDQRQAQYIATSPGNQQTQRCTPRKLWSILIPLIVVVGVIAALIFVFGINKDDFDGFVPSLEDFRQEDPFDGVSIEDANAWETKGRNGLSLELLNALSDEWYPYFYEAISDWENGEPDALTLTSAIRDYDYNCAAAQGKMKVCNGDYGPTSWRGINEIVLQNNFIINSVAKMNDYYFGKGDVDLRQYTMCHEQGHGFGLPHTDINFNNADLGNCMDYTQNYAVNKRPNRQTYEMLGLLYGNVTDSRDRDRHVRKRQLASGADQPLEPRLLQLWNEKMHMMEQPNIDATQHGWRRLHSSKHGEAHEIDLGDGIVFQVHKLLA